MSVLEIGLKIHTHSNWVQCEQRQRNQAVGRDGDKEEKDIQ